MPITKKRFDVEFDTSLVHGSESRRRLAMDPTQPVSDIYTLISERYALSNFELGARQRDANGAVYHIHPEDIIEDVLGDDERECIMLKRASFTYLSSVHSDYRFSNIRLRFFKKCTAKPDAIYGPASTSGR